MYIRQIIIEGFKSYREQVALEAFSPKVNCVVGANGSGKSNFLQAIRFVISDLFHNLCNEDRQAFLHEGAGYQVKSAFVEIVFDNSDNRILVDKEEVRLRRTIGLKKDEYLLDGKRIEKTEVMNLLEGAGFSRFNPYYVVPQGKIASLTLMKYSELLDLLKEIGGTQVYEKRLRESLEIMQDTGNKRDEIIQLVQYLDKILGEQDQDSAELKKYQQLDKQRKSIESTIYNKELYGARPKLGEDDAIRQLGLLQGEIQASAQEGNRVKPFYDDPVRMEEITRGYERMSINDLYKMLHKCNEKLKQFSHVSEKSLDPYTKFTDQRELLQKRLQECDAGNKKFKELISVLDHRKNESIERSFKGVDKHFREVFSELVQGGHGCLVMMKKKDGDQADYYEDVPQATDTDGGVEKYIGVKVKASFTDGGETQSMEQLSDDQKTVVALALIFAIQRFDPAPFYIFDEIDEVLDPQFRTAVGNMISQLADMGSTQFIATTFRSELVKVADKIYGVTYKNRVSRVDVVPREEALDFIEHDQSHIAE